MVLQALGFELSRAFSFCSAGGLLLDRVRPTVWTFPWYECNLVYLFVYNSMFVPNGCLPVPMRRSPRRAIADRSPVPTGTVPAWGLRQCHALIVHSWTSLHAIPFTDNIRRF